MATVYGVNKTKFDGGDVLDPGTWNARVKVSFDEYEASSLAAGSTIVMMPVPKGAKILGGKLYFDALGASTTLAVGDGTTADKYLSATDTSTAGSAEFDKIDNLFKALSATENITLTLAGGAATGTIKLMVMYALE